MSDKITRKVVLSIKKNIEMYEDEIAKVKENLSKIEEKYRKLAEEAKKDLESELQDLTKEHEAWSEALKRYDVKDSSVMDDDPTENGVDTNNNESSGTVFDEDTESPSVEQEVEEKVVDTLYPENNESIPEEHRLPDAEPQPEQQAEDETPEETYNESEPAAETETEPDATDNFEPQVSDFSDSDNQQNNDEGNPEGANAEAEWPEFPKEW